MKKNKQNLLTDVVKKLSRNQLRGLILLFALAILLLWVFGWLATETQVSLSEREELHLSPSQIQKIEDIGEWEFLSISNEELVDTVRNGFFSDDKLVRIYYGKLRLGLDMRQLPEGWCQTKGDTLVAVLPDVRLLDKHFIDEARTQPFYEEGKWTHHDRQLLYQKAERQMLQRCLTEKNLAEARSNAREQLEQLFKSLGFTNIIITFKNN